MKLRLIFSTLFLCLFLFSCQKENALTGPESVLKKEQTEGEILLLKHGFTKKGPVDKQNQKPGRRFNSYKELQQYFSSVKDTFVLEGARTSNLLDDPDPSEGDLIDEDSDNISQAFRRFKFPHFASQSFPSIFDLLYNPSTGEITISYFYFDGVDMGNWTYNHYSGTGNPLAMATLFGISVETLVFDNYTYTKIWGVNFTQIYEKAYITMTPNS